ncbi:hypothetical protein [Marinobacter sp. SS21]|uniref:hypothetical protein n=1 Tax=Marinobacter sp. SS21 TaxID=2979460 RepID=UPI0023302C50|nr:hypothetical protein [Marinobacter sp. SS21]MDC0663135.1 hypothetical protein [Marinobacter sp. SS21]
MGADKNSANYPVFLRDNKIDHRGEAWVRESPTVTMFICLPDAGAGGSGGNAQEHPASTSRELLNGADKRPVTTDAITRQRPGENRIAAKVSR